MNEFEKMKEKAIERLSILNEANVDNTHDGVKAALANIFKNGSYRDGAEAVIIVSQWMWADCETRYHAAKEENKKD